MLPHLIGKCSSRKFWLKTSEIGVRRLHSLKFRESNTFSSSSKLSGCSYNYCNFHNVRLIHTEALQTQQAPPVDEQKSSLLTPPVSLKFQHKLVLASIKTLVAIYDALTLPLYMVTQQPWKTLAKRKLPKSAVINKAKHIYGTVVPRSSTSLELIGNNIDNLDALFTKAFTEHASKPCFGTRDILSSEERFDPINKKFFKKFALGEYRWKTFAQIQEDATSLSKGFELLGIQPKDKIAIFAETREEWLLTAIAAFKRNLAVVTIFSVLGNDGVIHAINETEVTLVITSDDLLERCKEILHETPLVKKVIYMGKLKDKETERENLPSRIKIKSLENVIKKGSECLSPKGGEFTPGPNDSAIIMYTSGSTGVPKGVVMSHWNIVTNIMSAIDTLAFSMGHIGPPKDLYPAYLPVAHVMELIGEMFAFALGVKIGFSSPLTVIDSSVGLKEGTRGDLPVLGPTSLPSAPLVLERIVKGIKNKVAEKGPLVTSLFNYFYDYKVSWVKKGYSTPLLDGLFYSKFRAAVGGKVRLCTVGGAPLASHTHEFIETVLCTPVCISYGMTETSGLGAFTFAFDMVPGRVGGPIGGTTLLRLVNWEEGGYRVTDKPYPRGELYIGGESIALGGYYKRPELEDFFEDEDGTRWIKTGDIAELHEDGGFHVMDRKKDLVKLSTGEYVSLGKVESILKIHPVVENVCMIADPFESYAVTIVVPIYDQLLKLAQELDKSDLTFEEACKDGIIKDTLLKQLQTHGRQHKLEKYELPYKIHLSTEIWTPQSGLVTAALKNQRVNLAKAFVNEIKELYGKK